MRIDKLYILVLLLILILITKVSFSQERCFRKVNELDYTVERLLNSAAKHMILFILTQNESEYYESLKKIQLADSIQMSLLTESKKLTGIPRKIQDFISEDRVHEFICYRDEYIKEFILNEDKNSRTIKVWFNGKAYKLSKESKKIYKNFVTYYPQN